MLETMTQKNKSYQFPFNFNHALWATAILLEKIDEDVHYLDLASLLYIAERNHLTIEGEMLIGGTIYAMKHGPILGQTFRLIKGYDVSRSDEWARHIRILPKTDCVRLIHFPENFRLWSEQRKYLYDAVNRYYGEKRNRLSKLVRLFPEWKKHRPTTMEKRRIIPWEEILKARGREDMIEKVNHHFEIMQFVEEKLCKLRQ